MPYTTQFQDTFARPDSALGGLGMGWNDSATGAQTLSNKMMLLGSAASFVTRPAAENQVDQSTVVGIAGGIASGAILRTLVRFVDSNNWIAVFLYPGTSGFQIIKNVAGGGNTTVTSVTLTTAYVLANPHTITITATGTAISATILDTVTNATQTITGTVADSALQVASSTGVRASGANVTLTSFSSANDVATATALYLSAPPTCFNGQASPAFFVGANGGLASNVTVTPSDGGAGGTFTPSTVTLTTATPYATFTYTPASTGSKTISITNGSGLTNPASASTTANAPPITLGVSSAAFKFSPGNWKGDTGRGGTVYRQSWNNGAWFEVTWTASASPTATLLLPSTSSGNTLAIFLNGVLTDNVAATGNVALSGIIASASNTVRVYLRNSPQANRWNNAANTVQIQGLLIDSGSSGGTAAAAKPWGLHVGDSLSEGIAAANGSDSFLADYNFHVTQAMNIAGYDVGVSACGYSGYLTTGDSPADVPAYYYTSGGTYTDSLSRWNKLDNGVSLLDSNSHISAYGSTGQEPAYIYVHYGVNEALGSKSTTDLTNSITQFLTAARAAAPNALLLIQMPFGLRNAAKYSATYPAAIVAGVAAYQTANPTDGKVALIDFGTTLANLLEANGTYFIEAALVHPNTLGHAVFAAPVAAAILSRLNTLFAGLVSSVSGTDLVTIVRAGTTVQVTATALKAYLAGGGP